MDDKKNPAKISSNKTTKGIPVSVSKIPTSGRDSGTHSRSSSVSNLTTASDVASEAGDATSSSAHGFKLEDRVFVNGSKPGYIKFLGKAEFAPGIWAGVILDEAIGKNDGSVAGVKYFTCEPMRGIFARPQKLTRTLGAVCGIGDAMGSTTSLKSVGASSLKGAVTSKIGTASLRGATVTPGSTASLRGAGTSMGSTASLRSAGLTTPTSSRTIAQPVLSPGSGARGVCSKLKLGERVAVSSTTGIKMGILRFIGDTDFAKGEWAGIELDEPVGKNDGSVAGKRYFSCQMKYGLFSPMHKISRAGGTTSASRTPSLRGTPLTRSSSKDSLSSSISNCSRSSRVKLGVTSLTNSQKSRSTGVGIMTTSRALEEALKEKEQHIEQLLKEYELGRVEVAKLTCHIEEVEAKNTEAQNQKQKFEESKKELKQQMSTDKRKLEDLQFQLEEATIVKSDLELQLHQKSNIFNRLEEFLKEKLDNKFINIKEILDGQEILSEVTDNQNTDASHIFKEKISELECCLAKLTEEKSNSAKELENFQLQYRESEKTTEEQLYSLNNTIQEKDDVISNLRNELNLQLEKLTKVVADNQAFAEQISSQSTLEKGQTDVVIKEFGEKIAQLTEESKLKSDKIQGFENVIQEKDSKIASLMENLKLQTEQFVNAQDLNQSLNQSFKEKTSELTQQLALQKSLEDQVSALKLQMETEIPDKEKKILDLVKQIEQLTSSLQEKEDELAQKTTEINDLKIKLNELIENQAELKTKLSQAEENSSLSNKDTSEKLSALQNDINLLQSEKEEMKNTFDKELQKLKSEYATISHELDTERKNLFEKESELSSTKENLSCKDTECAQLQETLTSIKETNQLLTEQKTEVINNLNIKTEMLSTLENELSNFKNLIEQKDAETNKNKQEIESLLNSKKTVEEENAQLKSKLELSEQKVEMLNKDSSEHVMALQKEFSNLKEESDKLKTSLEQNIAEVQKENEKISSDLINEKKVIQEKEESILKLESQIQSKEKYASELVEEVETLKQSMISLEKQKNEVEETLKKQLLATKEEHDISFQDKEQELSILQKENEKSNNALNEAKGCIAQKEEVLSQLQNNLKYKEIDVNNLSTEVKDLHQKIAAITEEKEKIQESLQKQLLLTKEGLTDELKQREQAVEESMSKISEYEKMLENNKSELFARENNIASLKKTILEKESQFDELSKMIEASQAQLKQLNENNANNVKLLETKEMFITDFKSEMEKKLKEREESLKSEVTNLENIVSGKEEVTKQKDEIISKLMTHNQEQQKQIELLSSDVEKNKKLKEKSHLESENVYNEFTVKIADLEAKYQKLLEEKEKIASEELRTRNDKKNLEEVRDALMQEKVQQEEAVKDREAKLEALQAEVTKMHIEFTLHRQELQQKLDISLAEKEAALEIKNHLELQHSVLEELQEDLQKSDEKCKKLELECQHITSLTSEKDELINKVKEFEVFIKEKAERLSNMEEKKQASEELLKNSQNILLVKEKECVSLNEQIRDLKKEVESKEQLKSSLKSLEEENKFLKLKAEIKPSSSDKLSSIPAAESTSQMDSEERESLLSQIDFLNSIIVDMKQKNEELQRESEIKNSGFDENDLNLNEVRKLPPRLFCDICDMFDLHDTDDCPKQESFIDDGEIPHLVPQGVRKLDERPYCNNCEVFGHWTLDCNEEEEY